MKTKIPFEPIDTPDLEKAGQFFQEFCRIIAALRDPQNGCPWDLEQTYSTLTRFMVEEAYEASQAMSEGSSEEICDELGDVLLQVVLNAQLALQAKDFDISDVLKTVTEKMVRRHPHVFGDSEERKQNSLDEIKTNWNKIKAKEKKATGNIFEREKVHKVMPATTQSFKIGKLSRRVNFDFADKDSAFENFLEEVEELKEAWLQGNKENIKDELGDVFFCMSTLCRFQDLDPENTSMHSNKKFLKRYKGMCEIASNEGKEIESLSNKELEELWKRVKEKS